MAEVVAIPLRGRDRQIRGYALVDECDAERVRQHSWSISARRYVAARVDGPVVPLHRFLMGLPSGDKRVVDHINGDGFDNRRANLRVLANNGLNLQNSKPYAVGRSRFRGVYWHAQRGRWGANVQITGKRFSLGLFDVEEEAAAVAAAFRAKHMPYSRDALEAAATWL
jgi:hypothetical protein